jgi:glycosyltransferase involved in cell wall biosynthesis
VNHIVIIGKYYPPEFGGVERYTCDVARVAAKTHRVTVLVHNKGPEDSIEQSGNITVIRCGTSKIISSQPISLSMLAHLRSLQPDLVHFNAPNFWGAAMLLLSRYKGPLIVTHHADVFGRPLLKRAVMPIYHRLIRKAACIVVNSLKNASASADLPAGAGPFVTISHGVDARVYKIDGSEREKLMAERCRLFGDAPVVGFVGRFVRYKGLSVLVDALTRIDGVHALMIGDGPLRTQIEEQARTAGIAERMHFLGNVDEPTKIRKLALMDVLLLPSVDTTEAFGVTQVEAQLMEMPVVASRLPTGVTDVTIDNQTGLLVPPRDPDALAEAISRLICDRDFATRLGRAGRVHALKRFTSDIFQRRFEELFQLTLFGPSIEGSLKALASPAHLDRLVGNDGWAMSFPGMQSLK